MKRNGFTLIELLAVIVILAIIALIATPIILNIIGDTKESATVRSVEMYLSALNNSIGSSELNDIKVSDGTYDVLENGNICLEYTEDKCTKELEVEATGTRPKGNYVIIEKNVIKGFELIYGDKIIKKDTDGKLISIDNPYKQVTDSNPGIICGKGKEDDLSKEVCYIRSIEDLVAFSKLVNKGTSFEGKKVELASSLDFNNKKSYASKVVDQSLITGEGFTPIGKEYKSFQGIFEGNDNTIKGLYINRPGTNYVGLFGYVDTDKALIQNLNIEEFVISGKSNVGSLVGTNDKGTIQNIKVNNIDINAHMYSGGLIGTNYGVVSDAEIKNVEATGDYDYIAGLIGTNSGGFVENIKLNNIFVNGSFSPSGVIGISSNGTIKNINGDNIEVNTKSRGAAGLVGYSSSTITQINLTNIEIIGESYVGGIVGSNSGTISFAKVTNSKINGTSNYVAGLVGVNDGKLENSKFSGNVNGSNSASLGVGKNSGNIKNIVVRGDILSNRNNIGGLVGTSEGTSADALSTVSGVFLSGSVTGVGKNVNRTIGTSTNTILNTFAFSSILVKGNPVSDDFDGITTLHGKSLDNMGKVSSEEHYKTIGFDFNTSNECYWYFDENDELDLFIKQYYKGK